MQANAQEGHVGRSHGHVLHEPLGSLSTRTFQGDAVVKSAKAWFCRRRSRAKFNLFKHWCCSTARRPFSDPV